MPCPVSQKVSQDVKLWSLSYTVFVCTGDVLPDIIRLDRIQRCTKDPSFRRTFEQFNIFLGAPCLFSVHVTELLVVAVVVGVVVSWVLFLSFLLVVDPEL